MNKNDRSDKIACMYTRVNGNEEFRLNYTVHIQHTWYDNHTVDMHIYAGTVTCLCHISHLFLAFSLHAFQFQLFLFFFFFIRVLFYWMLSVHGNGNRREKSSTWIAGVAITFVNHLMIQSNKMRAWVCVCACVCVFYNLWVVLITIVLTNQWCILMWETVDSINNKHAYKIKGFQTSQDAHVSSTQRGNSCEG